MFGYACDETPELMPMPILYAHRLTARLAEVRKKNILNFLRPDGKSQVTIRYLNGKAAHVDAVVLAAQHSPDVKSSTLREGLIEEVVKKAIPAEHLNGETKYFINATGRFVVGGPRGDCGLTGRKIIVDTYGGMGRHGGGCFSGKDPTKVDRSACYMARYVAKNIVAAGLAERCEVQLAYAIGVADPVSVAANTFGTGQIDENRLVELIRAHFPLTPRGMIDHLKLRRPIYQKTAAFGHFGRTEATFSWEATDKAADLRAEATVVSAAVR
jgi:S-adenosylmethionine synthetase